jgi:signal transduction histidine kinase/CheY-like chemotaxis protein
MTKSPDINVLFVDDKTDFKANIRAMRRMGWGALQVWKGSDAIVELTAREYDAVVLDRNMPRITGDQILEWIYQELPRIRPCVVMLTGYPDKQSAEAAVGNAAYRYLEKPVSPERLLHVLRPGISLRLCDKMLGNLMTASNRDDLLDEARRVLSVACQPNGVNVVFVDAEGNVERIFGAQKVDTAKHRRGFVDKVLEGPGHRIYLKTKQQLAGMNPLMENAGSLMAVPVSRNSHPRKGVLEMESLAENAFDYHWLDLLSRLATLIGLASRVRRQVEQEKEAVAEESASHLSQEFRHSTASHAQIIAMQAERIREKEIPAIKRGKLSRPVLKQVDAIAKRAASISAHASAIHDVVDQLRSATTDFLHDPKALDIASTLDAAVWEARDACSSVPGGPVAVDADVGKEKIIVKGDATWLGYALNCILTNAREAIIEERNASGACEGQGIEVSLRKRDPDAVIEIQDHGIGIDPKVEKLIFQPLFSTKSRLPPENELAPPEFLDAFATGITMAVTQHEELRSLPPTARLAFKAGERGSEDVLTVSDGPDSEPRPYPITRARSAEKRGIGLYTARRVILKHHGTIRVSSKGLHQGATFAITLPLANG